MKTAWIENNQIIDVCTGNPSECYHPDIARHYYTDVPDDTLPGAVLIDGEWVNPVLSEPAPAEMVTPDVTVSPVEFKLLWLPQERVAIKDMRATDPVVDDFYELIEDPRLTVVNLSLASTQQAVDYLLQKLAQAGVLTESEVMERRDAILSGSFV